MDVKEYLAMFGREARKRGFAERVLCGTVAGPLMVWERDGEGAGRYLSAGIHGDEPAGPWGALELLRLGVFDRETWRLCPALNPTGLAAGTRDTADGWDLNRDYWHRRTAEVQAHAQWLESRPVPELFLSLHEDWEYAGFYFYEINMEADQPERAAAILDAVGCWLDLERCEVIDGHLVRAPGWIYHAPEADLPEQWPEAIFLAKRGCRASFTFETPTQAAWERRVAAQVAAVRAVLGHADGKCGPLVV